MLTADGFTIINGNVLYVNPDITDVVIPDGVTRIAAGIFVLQMHKL